LICIFEEKNNMICFPNAKINLGLNILSKRQDGFHKLESVFLPVGWSDILEVIPVSDSAENKLSMEQTGLPLGIAAGENLAFQACKNLRKDFDLPNLKIALHKQIPFGAGLGGGSSDAASMILLLDRLFGLSLSKEKTLSYLEKLGSDCPFFYANQPAFVRGRGDIIEPFQVNLNGYYLMIIVPEVRISTAEAFKFISPGKPDIPLKKALEFPVEDWKYLVKNDFEDALFSKYPEFSYIKNKMYSSGAVYSSLSGSGSAIYGIFRNKIKPVDVFPGQVCWFEKINNPN